MLLSRQQTLQKLNKIFIIKLYSFITTRLVVLFKKKKKQKLKGFIKNMSVPGTVYFRIHIELEHFFVPTLRPEYYSVLKPFSRSYFVCSEIWRIPTLTLRPKPTIRHFFFVSFFFKYVFITGNSLLCSEQTVRTFSVSDHCPEGRGLVGADPRAPV